MIVRRPGRCFAAASTVAMSGTAEWKTNRHLTVDLEHVHFFGGSYVRAARGSDVSFFSATTSFLF